MDSRIVDMVNLAFELGLVPIPLVGKRALVKGWTSITKETALEIINKTFKYDIRYNNIGIICGIISGIVVVDVDVKDGGLELWYFLCMQNFRPNTFTVRTGSGGYHYYFKYDERTKVLENMTRAIDNKGIDFKTTGGQVVFPGSIHPEKGEKYIIINRPEEVFAEMPDWLLSALINKGTATIPEQVETHDVEGMFKRTSERLSKYNNENESVSSSTAGKNGDSPGECLTVGNSVSKEQLEELIVLLSNSRSDSYESWTKGIWAIKNTNVDFIELAHEFSMKSTKYDKEKTDQVWNSTKVPKKPITFGTLMHWLEEDIGTQKYTEFKQKWNPKKKQEQPDEDNDPKNMYDGFPCGDLYDAFIKDRDDAVAAYLARRLRGNCFCVNVTASIFYIWDNTTLIWKKCSSMELLGIVYSETVGMFDAVSKYFGTQLGKLAKKSKKNETDEQDAATETMRQSIKFQLKRVEEMCKRTTCCSGKASILHLLANNVYVHKFDEDMNKTFGVLPVKDGLLINLKTGEVRKRCQEDKFTFECPVFYNPRANMTDINRYMNDISMGNDVKVLKTILGYSAIGGNRSQRVIFLHNPGGAASKSTLMNLLHWVLGEFYTSGDRSLAFRTKGTLKSEGGHNESTTFLEHRRLAVFCESSSSTISEDHLDEVFLKRVSGGDSISGRGLHEKSRDLKLWFLPFVVVNKMPIISDDASFWRRVVVLLMKAKFVDYPNPHNPFEKKADPDFITRLGSEENKSAFLNILIAGAQTFYQNGFPTNCDLNQYKLQCQANNDPILQFVYEVCDLNKDSWEECSTLWERYKNWYEMNKAELRALNIKQVSSQSALTTGLESRELVPLLNEEDDDLGSAPPKSRELVKLGKFKHSKTRRFCIQGLKLKTGSSFTNDATELTPRITTLLPVVPLPVQLTSFVTIDNIPSSKEAKIVIKCGEPDDIEDI